MANKVYIARETPVVFIDSGGDVVLTLVSLASAAGRVSARRDQGASVSTSQDFNWRIQINGFAT